MMEIFVNECSLHEQLYNQAELPLAFRKFFAILAVFNHHKATYTLYHHENLFTVYRITQSEPLIASLNKLTDKSLAAAIKGVLFNKLNAQDWQANRKHSSDDMFLCLEDIVTDTSMAELAERKLQNADLTGLLINFPQSKFTHLSSVKVLKNDVALPSNLDCLDNKDALNKWFHDKLQFERFEYNYASTAKPTDLQTVLRAHERFVSTTYYIDGRKVYKETTTDYYWYVDNLHYGRAAHLEVFDHQGQHIGEASLEGLVDTSKRDATKKVKW